MNKKITLKNFSFILALIMSLCLIFGTNAKLAFAEESTDETNDEIVEEIVEEEVIKSISVDLNDGVDYLVVASLPENATEVSMDFYFNETTERVETFEKTDNNYSFVFKGMLPQLLSEKVTATINYTIDGEAKTETKAKSVKACCEEVLEKNDDENPVINYFYKTMVADYLSYGAAAQVFTETGLDKLANENIGGYLREEITVDTSIASAVRTNATNFVWNGYTIYFDNAVGLVFRFDTTLSGIQYFASMSGKVVDVEVANKKAYIKNISPLDFDKEITLTAKLPGGEVATYTASVNSYVASMGNAVSDNMKNLAKALYQYGVSANNYQKSLNNQLNLQGIEIVSSGRTIYLEGENYDTNSLVVKANFDIGSVCINDYTVSNAALTCDMKEIEITYNYGEKVYTVKQDILVGKCTVTEVQNAVKVECEQMFLFNANKPDDTKDVPGLANVATASGGKQLGWMSGATRKGRGFKFEFTLEEDCTVLFVLGYKGRKYELNVNSLYSFTLQHEDEEAFDIVDDDFVLPTSDGNGYTPIAVLNLKAGKNIITMVYDSPSGSVACDGLDYYGFVSTTFGEKATYTLYENA